MELVEGGGGRPWGRTRWRRCDAANDRLSGDDSKHHHRPESHIALCREVPYLPVAFGLLVGILGCLTGFVAGKYLYRLAGGGSEVAERFDALRFIGVLLLGASACAGLALAMAGLCVN